MKLFKKTAMSLALGVAVTSGALMMGVSTPVQAVNIAQDGLGQVLVFPYYTTRNGWNSYFNITNTSNKTVAIKVRWREGMNSRDARDFNVILSPYDVWTAAVVDGKKGAKIITSDNSCTAPLLPIMTDVAPAGRSANDITGVDFTNTAYTKVRSQDNRDKGSESLDRTREGYFEVIEMGVAKSEKLAVAVNSKHKRGVKNNQAMPKDCRAVSKMFLRSNIAKLERDFNPPANVLKGRAVLINAQRGIAAGYDPLVLANFNQISNMIAPPADAFPNLNGAVPADSVTVDDNNIRNNTTISHVRGVDAVSQLILRNGVINDYNVATGSETDWVLTFPTKGFYVDKAFSASANFASISIADTAPKYPFDSAVNGERFSGSQDGKSCFDVRVSMWDREEYRTTIDEDVHFSPSEPGEDGDRMCYEANILSFGASDIFGSKLSKSFFADDPTQLPGENGWAKVTFGNKGASLPVVGMRVEVRNKGDATVNFGFANNHAYTHNSEAVVAPVDNGAGK